MELSISLSLLSKIIGFVVASGLMTFLVYVFTTPLSERLSVVIWFLLEALLFCFWFGFLSINFVP